MDAKKRQKGITLIALVVTIVVLLILAGITISLVFGSNGVIQKAQDSKEQTKIGEMREKLEMAKVPVYADGNGSYKVQDYWGRIESEGLIADKTVDIIDNKDGTYEVTTTPGYVFEITVEPNKEVAENIIIGECIGKGENLSIGIRVVKKTTNSIEIEVVRAEKASNFKYSIKKQGEEYGAAEEKSETRHVFSGLTQGGIYTIKVEATKDGEQQIVEKTLQVGEIPLAIDGDVIWTGNGQASVRIYTEEEGYQLEWQKNEIVEGSWTRETSGVKEKTITGLVNGDIIYARLYDGTSSGKYANIEVRDDIVPTATIKLSGTAVEIGKPLTAEVVQTDNESGININQTKWVLNTEAGNIGIEASKYTGGTFAKTQETITIPTTTGGTYYLHVLTVDNAGNKKEIISSAVTIKSSIVGGEYNEGKGVNTPRYDENQMTPIKWNGSSWVKTAGNDPDWYDYTEKKWANAMTEDGSMWVWIPRYAYSITSGYHSSSTGNIDVEFMKGLTNETSTGRKSFDNVSGQGKWNIHPAFNYGTAVSGLWVAKFEASNGSGKIKVEPGVQSWRSVTVNNIYTSCLNYNKTLNSHMMKNDEWGAVAYLSKSKYGKNAEVTINSNSSYYTGGGSGNAYVSNIGQSTTGTVHGVYDMSGGAWEYVAAYVDNSYTTSYGSSLVNGDAKTKNVYSKASTDNATNNYNANSSKYGDAVYETSTSGSGSTSWYGDYSDFPNAGGPFFQRGGHYTGGTDEGVFFFYNYYGGTSSYLSFRPVLVAF